MDVRHCIDCNEYKYIEKNGLCRDCYNSETKNKTQSSNNTARSNSSNVSLLSNVKNNKKSNIELNIFNRHVSPNRCIIGSFRRNMSIISGLEMFRLKKYFGKSNLNVYIIDDLNVFSRFIKYISGDIVSVGNNFNINNYNISNRNICFNINDKNANVGEILETISSLNKDKSVIYLNMDRLNMFDMKKIEKSIRRSRHYNTSVTFIKSDLPSRLIQSNCPITRIHHNMDKRVLNRISKITSNSKANYVRNADYYPNTNSPDILYLNSNNKFKKKKFDLSSQELKILSKI